MREPPKYQKGRKNANEPRIRDATRRQFVMLPNSICRTPHPRGYKDVLLAVASHAGTDGSCYASAETINAETGVKRDTIFKAIRYWEAAGALCVERKRGLPTEIALTVDLSEPVPETGRVTEATSPGNGTPPVPETGHPPVPETGHKEESHEEEPLKKKHPTAPGGAGVMATGSVALPGTAGSREVAQVIEVFQKTINPGINYGHRTHRAAVEWLVARYGLEKTLAMARYAVEVAGQEYAPTITNPSELKDKLGKLVIFKKKNGAPARVRIS